MGTQFCQSVFNVLMGHVCLVIALMVISTFLLNQNVTVNNV